jgi:hypothetical protein
MNSAMSNAGAAAICLIVAAGGPIVAASLGLNAHAQPVAAVADAPVAGDRVALDSPSGLKGVVVKIGGAGDAYYYQGCYGIHYDYEKSDPNRLQWTCPNNGGKSSNWRRSVMPPRSPRRYRPGSRRSLALPRPALPCRFHRRRTGWRSTTGSPSAA